jgi:glycosyltransferase involved in cell wall biosynthesis
VAPQTDALASALERLARAPDEARRLGAQARAKTTRTTDRQIAETLLGDVSPGARIGAVGRPFRVQTRVVILDNQPIEPPIGGGRIRLLGLYSNLPADFDPVYVGTYDWRGPGYRSVLHPGGLREVTVPQSKAHFQAHDALRAADPSLGMDVTFPVLSSLSEGFVERVLFEARKADLLVFSHPWVFPVVARDAELAAKPFVYDAQNAEGRLRRSLLASGGLGAGMASNVESLEREVCRRAAAIFACSEEDAREFVDVYGVDADRVHVVPNGTNVHRLRPATAHERRAARASLGLPATPPVALFVGSDYPPNAEAARSLCRDVAPELAHVQFVIVGGCTKDLASSEVPGNVRVLDVVDAATRDRALAAADVAVNPMSRGSGTNVKMLDFFCAGLPVVTTPVGARGLSAGAGTAYVVATLADFPAALRDLLTSPGEAARMGRRARLLAESRYDWRRIGASAGSALRQVLRAGRRGPGLPPPSHLNRPKVALLSTWKTHCGIADYAEALARAFPRDGEWRVYAEASGCGVTDSPGVRRNWEIGLEDLSRLASDLDRDAPDVLFVQHNPAFFREDALRRLLELAREKGVAVALTLHAVQGLRIDPALASDLSRAGRVYVHRRADADRLARLSVAKGVRVVPHGIARIPERSSDRVKDQIGLGGRFLIGHFGYLRPHKGVLELIEAYERVAAADPRAELLLLCSEYPSSDSRDYRVRCESRIAHSSFSERIHASFSHLPLDTAGFLLQGCDLLVFPYLPSGESASGAVRLALAAGRPLIVSDSSIFDELDGVAETSSIDPEALAATIRRFDSAEVRSAAGARVRRFASKHEWTRVGSLVWGDLRSLVEERLCAEGAA